MRYDIGFCCYQINNFVRHNTISKFLIFAAVVFLWAPLKHSCICCINHFLRIHYVNFIFSYIVVLYYRAYIETAWYCVYVCTVSLHTLQSRCVYLEALDLKNDQSATSFYIDIKQLCFVATLANKKWWELFASERARVCVWSAKMTDSEKIPMKIDIQRVLENTWSKDKTLQITLIHMICTYSSI